MARLKDHNPMTYYNVIIFAIEPPLRGEDIVLCDDAKMTLNMIESLLNVMKHCYYTNKHE